MTLSALEQIAEEIEAFNPVSGWAARIRAWIEANGPMPTLVLLKQRTQELEELKAFWNPQRRAFYEAAINLAGGFGPEETLWETFWNTYRAIGGE